MSLRTRLIQATCRHRRRTSVGIFSLRGTRTGNQSRIAVRECDRCTHLELDLVSYARIDQMDAA